MEYTLTMVATKQVALCVLMGIWLYRTKMLSVLLLQPHSVRAAAHVARDASCHFTDLLETGGEWTDVPAKLPHLVVSLHPQDIKHHSLHYSPDPLFECVTCIHTMYVYPHCVSTVCVVQSICPQYVCTVCKSTVCTVSLSCTMCIHISTE